MVLKKISMIRHLFTFKGRIGRGEFVMTYIVCCLYWGLQSYVASDFFFIYFVGLIVLTIMLMAQAAKRCHDLGKSGWFQLIPFYFLWLLCGRGEEHGNEYGDCIR